MRAWPLLVGIALTIWVFVEPGDQIIAALAGGVLIAIGIMELVA